jgi:hypothetical protein
MSLFYKICSRGTAVQYSADSAQQNIKDFPLGFLNVSSTVITVRKIIIVSVTYVYTDLAKL